MVAALALVGACHAEPSKPPAPKGPLKGPTHFLDGRKKDPWLLGVIRDGMAEKIDFAGRFSLSVVSCGTACNSFWFVDRYTGGVLDAPESPVAGEYTWEIVTKPDSDRLRLIVGSMDGDDPNCISLPYRWTGHAFVAAGKRSPVKCPG